MSPGIVRLVTLLLALGPLLLPFTSVVADDDPDGDGISAEWDECPDEPEDFDGVEDSDGCPEENPPVAPAPSDPDRTASFARDLLASFTSLETTVLDSIAFGSTSARIAASLERWENGPWTRFAAREAELRAFLRRHPDDHEGRRLLENDEGLLGRLALWPADELTDLLLHIELGAIPIQDAVYVDHTVTDTLSVAGLYTHRMVLTFDTPFPDGLTLRWDLDVMLLETPERIAITAWGDPEAEQMTFREHRTPLTDAFAEATVEAVAHGDPALVEDLLPPLADVQWQLDHRVATDEAGEYPTYESLEALYDDVLWDQYPPAETMADLREWFLDLADDRPVEDVRLLDYELLAAEAWPTFTHGLDIRFAVDHPGEPGVEYGMIVGAMQGRSRFYFGSSPDGAEVWLVREEEDEGPAPEEDPSLVSDVVYFGPDGTGREAGCDVAESQVVSARVAAQAGDLEAALEKSTKVVECPYGLKLSKVIEAHQVHGVALAGLATTGSGAEVVAPAQLTLAIESFTDGLALADDVAYARRSPLYHAVTDARSELYAVAVTAFNHAIAEYDAGNTADALPILERLARAAVNGYLVGESAGAAQMRGYAGYLVAAEHMNRGDMDGAAPYLPLVVPVDETLLTLSREEITDRLVLDAGPSSTLYFNLGSYHYNRAAEALTGSPGAALTSGREDVAEDARAARTCFSLAKKLGAADVDGALEAVDQVEAMLDR